MTRHSLQIQHSPTAIHHARHLVLQVCNVVDQTAWVDDLRRAMDRFGLSVAVENHDTAAIFDWLMWELSFQGISDTVAEQYIDRHGNVTWADIEQSFTSTPKCDKLEGYWVFTGCHYQKGAQTCTQPRHFAGCPVPVHPLRNGRLNQTAYSLFLFIRDLANGDLVGWIDRQVKDYVGPRHRRDFAAARAALLAPLRNIYGVSDKVITMALASLLMGAGESKPEWFEVGAGLIVVDTLVHNFLHRTGILHRLETPHLYGPACYRPGGCADVVLAIAKTIDARRFNQAYPKVFPRLIQSAIWQYCSQTGFDICNGNQIDDRARCTNTGCQLYSRCDRIALHPAEPQSRRTTAANKPT